MKITHVFPIICYEKSILKFDVLTIALDRQGTILPVVGNQIENMPKVYLILLDSFSLNHSD